MRKNFILALVGIGIGGIGFGLIAPVTVMLLEQKGEPSMITGSVTMVGYLGVVMFSGYAGKLIDRLGVKKILLLGLFIWMLGALLHLFWYIIPLLYPIKFFMGIGGTFVFVSTEVMINYYSNETNRGRNIGLYVVLLSIGIAIGTLLIWTTKFGSWVPFVIGSSIMLIVLIIQSIFFEEINLYKEKIVINKMPISKMPLMSLISSAVYGLFESSVIVALPLYGLRNNFSSDDVSYFLAAFVTGGIFLLYLISLFSDRVSKYKLLLYISAALGILFIVPVAAKSFSFLIVVFFIIGGIVPAFYSVGLNYTVEQVDKQFIAQANGYYVMMYGVGTIAGPLIGAFLVDLNKEYGYWIFASALCYCFYLIFNFYKNGD